MEVYCCLDFFLVSLSIVGRILNVDIFLVYKIDYFLCIIDISYYFNFRGFGFWKLNFVFLSEVDYVNVIKLIIVEIVSEYESDEEVDEVLLWEMIKFKIRDVLIKYFKVKMKMMKNEEVSIESVLVVLEW